METPVVVQRTSETILRLPAVLHHTGLSRSSIYLKVNQGIFPRPVKLGKRSIGWMQSEVDQWLINLKPKPWDQGR